MIASAPLSNQLLTTIRDENLNVYRASPQRLREDVGQENEVAQNYRGHLIYELLQNADDAMASLHRHRLEQVERRLALGTAYSDHGLVFVDELGGPVHPNTLGYRFKRLIEKAGVPMIRFHDLRHTSATLMLANNVHPKIVQERLGHADISMTLNRYSHVTMDMQRDAADRLDALVGAEAKCASIADA